MPNRIITYIVLSLGLLGCAAINDAPISVVAQMPTSQPSDFSAVGKLDPLLLDRVTVFMEKGSVIGENRQGTMCIFPKKRIWDDSNPGVWTAGQYHNAFQSVLKEVKYNISYDSETLFPKDAPYNRELIVRAKISEISENFCGARKTGFLGDITYVYKGSASISVCWEVYSRVTESVVFQEKTFGSAKGEHFRPMGEHQYYAKAFGNALRNLLSKTSFIDFVIKQKSAAI